MINSNLGHMILHRFRDIVTSRLKNSIFTTPSHLKPLFWVNPFNFLDKPYLGWPHWHRVRQQLSITECIAR